MDDEVERSWTVNSAKRRAQHRQQNRGRRHISSRTLMFMSLILLQLAILACVAVILWRVQDAAAVTGQTEGQTWCKDQPCQNNGVCVEATDGRYCVCKGGWVGDSCESDVNECKTAECHPLATCQNTAGSYSCQCDEGYQGDGLQSCTDKDECLEEDICGPNSISCSNTIGSYNCSCQQGFISNGTGCVDLDECLTSPCHEFADCVNLPGNYTCTCRPGYTGDGLGSCQVLLCENQEDDWSLGSSISDGSWSGLTNDCAQPDSYPFPTSSCGQNGGQAVEMTLTAMPEDYMDQWQYRVDGTHAFTGGAYYQTARYDNGWNYEYVNRLKFQPRHANHDARFQGFFFDDIHYGVFDSSSSENVIEEYCISFEE
ncbi:uncharacterized protein LOC144927359 [Branchiostoma floridae x Branchiostoma belcheri]